MPAWIEHELIRFDFLLASITSQTDLYHFNERIEAEINTHSDGLRLNALVNGKNVSVANLPLWFNRHLDAKFDRPEQMAFSVGYARKLSTFKSDFYPQTYSNAPIHLLHPANIDSAHFRLDYWITSVAVHNAQKCARWYRRR